MSKSVDAILMGNDFYETSDQLVAAHSNGRPLLGVGEGSRIRQAIIDKNCRIGRNVQILNEEGLQSTEETAYGMIRDGIAVIPKDTVLPDGFRM